MSEPIQYGIRFSVEAKQNVISIAHAFLKWSGDVDAATLLIDFFYDEAGVLASFLDRHKISAAESLLLGHDVRRLLVRRGTRTWNMAYRIENEEDGPVVWVICVRDARIDLTADEAEHIRSNQ